MMITFVATKQASSLIRRLEDLLGESMDKHELWLLPTCSRKSVLAQLTKMYGKCVVPLGAAATKALGARTFQYGCQYSVVDPTDGKTVLVPFMVPIPNPVDDERRYKDEAFTVFVMKTLRALAGMGK